MTSQMTFKRFELELQALTEVAKTLNMHLGLEELLETVLGKIAEVLDPADFGILFLLGSFERIFHAKGGLWAGYSQSGSGK
jgi:hypothetical protein